MSNECDTECKSDCNAGNQPECGSSSSSECPIECATAMWDSAFKQAMGAAMAERIKARIDAQWGEVFDKEADAMVKSMGACWGSQIAKVQAHLAREEFKKTIMESWLAAGSKEG